MSHDTHGHELNFGVGVLALYGATSLLWEAGALGVFVADELRELGNWTAEGTGKAKIVLPALLVALTLFGIHVITKRQKQ